MTVLYTPQGIPYGFHMEWVDSMDSRWNSPWIPCGMVHIPRIPYGMGQFHGLHLEFMEYGPFHMESMDYSPFHMNPWKLDGMVNI
jgi:hypothetical protein